MSQTKRLDDIDSLLDELSVYYSARSSLNESIDQTVDEAKVLLVSAKEEVSSLHNDSTYNSRRDSSEFSEAIDQKEKALSELRDQADKKLNG